MLRLVILCLLFKHSDSHEESWGLDIENVNNLYERNGVQEQKCTKDNIPVESCDEPLDDDGYFDSGTLCSYVDGIDDIQVICIDGHWTAYDWSKNVRQKRSHSSCYRSRRRRWTRRRRRHAICSKPNHAPTFTRCSGNIVKYATAKSHDVTVTWSAPFASDIEDGTPSVTNLTPNYISGMKFTGSGSGRTYTVSYSASDRQGLRAYCNFRITVFVITCPVAPQTPAFGHVSCDYDLIYGNSCYFTCAKGYAPFVNKTTCTSTGKWDVSLDAIKCQSISCPETTPTIPNGELICSGYTYGSICTPVCNAGYGVAVALPITCGSTAAWSTPSPSTCKDIQPPTILVCPSSMNVQAEPGLTSAIVTWSLPSANDVQDGASVTIQQITGIPPGNRVSYGVIHLIQYIAFDTAGNPSLPCMFTVSVNVIRCPSLHAPNDGLYECDAGMIYGSHCTFTCKKGFILRGSNGTSCQQSGQWSDPQPDCEELTCPSPEDSGIQMTNGELKCAVPIVDKSVCYAVCNNGYTLTDNSKVVCGIDADNNAALKVIGSLNCKDYVPPTLINCKTYQTFYMERGQTYANITWEIPIAVDNVDNQEDIEIEQIGGPVQGTLIPIGDIDVEYRAVDSAGNPSLTTCVITLVVQDVSCIQPKYQFTDNNIIFTCTSYLWGDTCGLSCPVKQSMTLSGPDLITCEAVFAVSSPTTVWQFDGTIEPYCESQVCPRNFTAPQNGALVYTNEGQPILFIMCNSGYDLPLEHTGQMFCLSSGLWNPDTVPDCTVNRRPGLNILPIEFTYDGDCNDPEVIAAIKEKILEMLEEFLGTAVAPSCLDESTCGFDDLTLLCNMASNRQNLYLNQRQARQTTGTLVVQLKLTITGEVASHTDLFRFEDKLIEIAGMVETAIQSNQFDLEDFIVLPNSFSRAQFSEIVCKQEGQVLNGFQCKSCAVGTYLSDNAGSKSCADCPRGTYMDHDSAIECIKCPDGTRTNSTGSKVAEMCTPVCPVGYISASGVMPCEPCPLGYYQDSEGMSECIECPAAQTTLKTGSTRCHYYELSLHGNGSNTIYITTSEWNELTAILWIRQEPNSQFNMTFGNGLQISLSKEIQLVAGDHMVNISKPHGLHNRWAQYGIVLLSDKLDLYVDGSVLKSQQFSTVDIPASSNFDISYEANKEQQIGGFMLLDRAFNESEVTILNQTCLLESFEANLTIDDVAKIGLTKQESSCIGDSCLSSPCGEHICTTTPSGYKCSCPHGLTGQTCDDVIDHCADNGCVEGQCNNTVDGYTCICQDGYSGTFCDIEPVDGMWGLWLEWSDCSTTCGQGQRSRSRTCDNPTPGPFGNMCAGQPDESTTCSSNCFDSCDSKPCGNGHDCIVDGDGFKCHCKGGFSGETCNIHPNICKPNPCKNSGVCEDNTTGFLCTCTEGYTGDTCEIEPDESLWEVWTAWSTCSASCGDGTRSRRRFCKTGGRHEECLGVDSENDMCSYGECQACPNLPEKYGLVLKYTEENETRTCVVTCRKGYFLANGTSEVLDWSITYQCGPDTAHLWNTTDAEYRCSKGSSPQGLLAGAGMILEPQVPCELTDKLEAAFTRDFSSIACQDGLPCNVSASVSDCKTRSKRQSAGTDQSNVRISFNFEFSEESHNQTHENDSMDYWDIIYEALSPIVEMEDKYRVVVDGVTFEADTRNISDDSSSVLCKDGYFVQGGHALCVGCSPGTMFDGDVDYCVLCPLGTYQELTAQFSCHQCPEGFTTNDTGSWNRNDCFDMGNKVQHTKDEGNKDELTIIGSVVGSILGVAVTLVVIVVIWRIKRVKEHTKVGSSTVELATDPVITNVKTMTLPSGQLTTQ